MNCVSRNRITDGSVLFPAFAREAGAILLPPFAIGRGPLLLPRLARGTGPVLPPPFARGGRGGLHAGTPRLSGLEIVLLTSLQIQPKTWRGLAVTPPTPPCEGGEKFEFRVGSETTTGPLLLPPFATGGLHAGTSRLNGLEIVLPPSPQIQCETLRDLAVPPPTPPCEGGEKFQSRVESEKETGPLLLTPFATGGRGGLHAGTTRANGLETVLRPSLQIQCETLRDLAVTPPTPPCEGGAEIQSRVESEKETGPLLLPPFARGGRGGLRASTTRLNGLETVLPTRLKIQPKTWRDLAVTPPTPPCEGGEKFQSRARSETSFKSLFLSWLGVLLLGAYLLFAHGCHADVDDEPGLLPDLTNQRQATAP